MASWSGLGGGQIITNAGASTAVSRGTTVTAAATANTKGSTPTQLIAATPYEAQAIVVMFDDCAAGIDYLVDIMIGAGGSEVVLLPDLYVGGGTGSVVYGAYYIFRVGVPAGVRLSARCQASTLSSVVRVSCLLVTMDERAPAPFSIVTAYGANTADSGGTSIDPGGVANTKPALPMTQIAASTTYPISELHLAFGNQLNTVRSSQSWLVDIGIGAASSEQIIIPNIALNCSTSPDIVAPQTFGPIPCHIPAGTRLSARAQSDGVDATDRLFDCIVYGVS